MISVRNLIYILSFSLPLLVQAARDIRKPLAPVIPRFLELPAECDTKLRGRIAIASPGSRNHAERFAENKKLMAAHMSQFGYTDNEFHAFFLKTVTNRALGLVPYGLNGDFFARLELDETHLHDLNVDPESAARAIVSALPWFAAHTKTLKWLPSLLPYVHDSLALLRLTTWSPLWQNSEIRDDVFQAIVREFQTERGLAFTIREAAMLLGWLLENAKQEELPDLKRVVVAYAEKRIKREPEADYQADHILSLVSLLPLSGFPQDFRNHLSPWIDESINPVIEMEGIYPLRENVKHTGWCREMFRGHFCTVLTANSTGGSDYIPLQRIPLYIKLNGTLVGVMKRAGDPSMLALRNVRDKEGKMVLVAGGTYVLSKTFVDALLLSPKTVVDVKKLSVAPNSFLLNLDRFELKDAWESFIRTDLINNGFDLQAPERPALWKIILRQIQNVVEREKSHGLSPQRGPPR